MRGFCLVPCHPGRHSPDQKLCNCTFIDKVTRRATFHRIHRTTNFSNELVRQNVIEITWIHQMATQVSPPTNYPTNQPPHMRQLDLWPRFQSKYFNNVTRLSSSVLWRTPKELSRPSPGLGQANRQTQMKALLTKWIIKQNVIFSFTAAGHLRVTGDKLIATSHFPRQATEPG